MVQVPNYIILQVTYIIEGVVQDSISKDTCCVLERAFGTNIGKNLQFTPSQKDYKWQKQRKGCQTFYKHNLEKYHKIKDSLVQNNLLGT